MSRDELGQVVLDQLRRFAANALTSGVASVGMERRCRDEIMIAADKMIAEAGYQAKRPAVAFADVWSELFPALPDDYGCHMTCTEVEAAAEFLRGHGYPETAGAVLGAHARHDDEGDAHYQDGR